MGITKSEENRIKELDLIVKYLQKKIDEMVDDHFLDTYQKTMESFEEERKEIVKKITESRII